MTHSVVTRGRRHTVVNFSGQQALSKVLLVTIVEAKDLDCGACLVYFKVPETKQPRLAESELQFATSTIDPRKSDAVWNECFDLPWHDDWENKALRFRVLRNRLVRKGDDVYSGSVDLRGLGGPQEIWIDLIPSGTGEPARLLIRLHLEDVDVSVYNKLTKRLVSVMICLHSAHRG